MVETRFGLLRPLEIQTQSYEAELVLNLCLAFFLTRTAINVIRLPETTAVSDKAIRIARRFAYVTAGALVVIAVLAQKTGQAFLGAASVEFGPIKGSLFRVEIASLCCSMVVAAVYVPMFLAFAITAETEAVPEMVEEPTSV